MNTNYKPPFKVSADKILFSIAAVYLVAVTFWLAGQGKLKLPWMTSSPGQQRPISPADAEFIAYLRQSLQQIELQSNQTSKSTPETKTRVPVAPAPSNLPTETRVIEKIYIPIYPQNNPNSPVTVNTQPGNSTVPPLPPAPPTEQAFTTPSTVPVLTPGNSLLPTAPPTPVSQPDTLLVGLLEAGEKSSALFTINGSTRRVTLGEVIGGTGWTLQAIQNQQAIISRQGNVRYLEVGKGL
jgi:hypothetical protein